MLDKTKPFFQWQQRSSENVCCIYPTLSTSFDKVLYTRNGKGQLDWQRVGQDILFFKI